MNLDDIRADLAGALITLAENKLTDKQKIEEADKIISELHDNVHREIERRQKVITGAEQLNIADVSFSEAEADKGEAEQECEHGWYKEPYRYSYKWRCYKCGAEM